MASSITVPPKGNLLFMCFGSRGDTQPFLSLASALTDHGYEVQATCNIENVSFFEKMGIIATGAHFNMTELLDTPAMREQMNSGADPSETIVNEILKHYDDAFSKILDVIEIFKPDVLLPGLDFDLWTARAIGTALKIPVVFCPLSLQHTRVPSTQIQTEAHEPPWMSFAVGLLIHKVLSLMVWSKFAETARAKLGGENGGSLGNTPLWGDDYGNFVDELVSPDAIVLMQHSNHVKALPTDLPVSYTAKLRPSGFWVVPAEKQVAQVKSGDKFWGAGDVRDALADMESFLARGDIPVYLGWGSMIAKTAEHMAALAVGALKAAGLRGIVLGGGAGLSMESLATDEELQMYAAENVLFVKSAPHEWLFPRVAATVHHGGMGTTIAAFRSGKPTVVTPCVLDQFSNADSVTAAGVGIGLKKPFNQVTVEELAVALTTATSDASMTSAAASLGSKLQAEDGLGMACQAIDGFFEDELLPGKWAAAFEETLAKRARPSSACPGWCAKVFCSSTPFGPVAAI